jgi:xanthine dehydrogenase YagT iron-sulfur-binding subunit
VAPHDKPQNLSSGATKQGDSSKVTRRQFISIAGTITGGMAVKIPNVTGGNDLASVTADAPHDTLSAHAVSIELVINGRTQKWSLDPRVTLLDLLRENAGLTGTKKGCDHGQCGACTVLVNGVRINSCLSLAVTHDRDEIITIEGIAISNQLGPLQTAFLEHDGFQCGYCTPGQICSAVALLRESENGDASAVTQDLQKQGPCDLTLAEIRERMSGNICRCGAYLGIVQAVQSVSEHMKANLRSQGD